MHFLPHHNANPVLKSIPALFAIGMLFSCENDPSNIKALNVHTEAPLMTSYGSEITYNDSGKTLVRLKAAQLDQYFRERDQKKWYEASNGLKITFYDSLMQESATLTGRRGRFEELTTLLEVNDDVRLHGHGGELLQTEQLFWNQRTAQVHTDKFVKITRKKTMIWGMGLEAKQDFSKYRIRHVQGEIPINKKETAETHQQNE